MDKTTETALSLCEKEKAIRQHTSSAKRALRRVTSELNFLKLQYAHYMLHPALMTEPRCIDETKKALAAFREHLELIQVSRSWLLDSAIHELDRLVAIEKEFSAQFQALLGYA